MLYERYILSAVQGHMFIHRKIYQIPKNIDLYFTYIARIRNEKTLFKNFTYI